MKRILIILISQMLAFTAVFGLETSLLVDFHQLGDVKYLNELNKKVTYDPSVDAKLYSNTVSNIYTRSNETFESGEFAITNGFVSLATLHNDNWRVYLNDSSQSVENRELSYCKNVETKGKQDFGDRSPDNSTNVVVKQKQTYVTNATNVHTAKGLYYYPSNDNTRNVLGIRIHYPIPAWSSYGKVRPPFEIEFYGGYDGKKFHNGRGVVDNVGTIKEVTSWVNGRNFKIAYSIDVRDRGGKERSFFMGYLYFRGWVNTKWENPNYLTKVRDRKLKRERMYPVHRPAVKLENLTFYRDKSVAGGDFVTYIRDIKLTYDEAIPDIWEEKMDIEDEDVWHILKKDSYEKRVKEAARVKEHVELYEIEKDRMMEKR